MRKKKVLLLLLLLCIVSIIISIISIFIYAHYVVLRESMRSPEYRVLSAEEIRPILSQITGRQLPDKAENLRAIYSKLHSGIENIFLAFHTDQEGFSLILNEFGGQKVQIIEFPESEAGVPWRASMLSIFSSGCYQQEQLGIELFDEDLLNRIYKDFEKWDYKTGQYPKDVVTGWYLKSPKVSGAYYAILLFKDEHLAYIYAGKNPKAVRRR